MKFLITGGNGFIGSHTSLKLMMARHEVVIFDNFSNSHPESFKRVCELGRSNSALIQGDIRDRQALRSALQESRPDAVIHFAGLKAVGESVQAPLSYYDNNVAGTLCLLEAMREEGIKTLVFSSSATVYGVPQQVPLHEDHPRSATNPYGRTKLILEDVLEDLHISDPTWRIARLRYFNPVGAHPSGRIGENPHGVPSNLMPYICQVAVGRREYLSIYGGDYATSDGTAIRDYIHVEDLASGHMAALDYFFAQKKGGLITVNLGTGRGYSVLDVVAAFEEATGKKIPYNIVDRRPGDVPSCYADVILSQKLLGWKSTRDLEEMCADAWRWQSQNPLGFQ